MVDSQSCVNCGKKAPETDTNYTLISAQFGWRLTRFKGPDGSLVLEWRCPSCWREYKQRTRSAAPPTPDPGVVSRSPSSLPRSSPPVSTGSGAPAAPSSGPPRGSRRTPR